MHQSLMPKVRHHPIPVELNSVSESFRSQERKPAMYIAPKWHHHPKSKNTRSLGLRR